MNISGVQFYNKREKEILVELILKVLESGDRVLIYDKWYEIDKTNGNNSTVICKGNYHFYTWRIRDIEGPKGKELRSFLVLSKLQE
jgi:hypothetical protein